MERQTEGWRKRDGEVQYQYGERPCIDIANLYVTFVERTILFFFRDESSMKNLEQRSNLERPFSSENFVSSGNRVSSNFERRRWERRGWIGRAVFHSANDVEDNDYPVVVGIPRLDTRTALIDERLDSCGGRWTSSCARISMDGMEIIGRCHFFLRLISIFVIKDYYEDR